MMRKTTLWSLLLFSTLACSKIDELKQPPELTPLEDGFRTSAAIGYCISIATRALTGQTLPPNILYTKRSTDGYSSSGLIHIPVDPTSPVPFNGKLGDITIAGIWNEGSGGVISIIFSDFNVVNGDFKFYGIHTIPIIVRSNTNEIVSVFAQQDIVIGEGSDTLLNLSLSKPKFDAEINRMNSAAPADAFVAVKQNVWHLTVTPNATAVNFLDDDYKITGGGQIAEARSESGGVLYHAMIDTKFNFNQCSQNPLNGSAFIQNFKAGSTLDFGTILIDFHSSCDGHGKVTLATGKYAASNGKNLQLNWH